MVPIPFKGIEDWIHADIVRYCLLCFQQYLDGPLNLTIQALQKSHLEAMRTQGVDVRRHIIDTGEL